MPDRIPARQFRLEEAILDQIDALATHLGLSSRAEVLRHAVRRLALVEGLAPSPAKSTAPKKTRKKV